MKRVISYAAFAVVAYVVFLLVNFPADRAYALVKSHLAPRIQLYGLEGSVWHGHADVAQLGQYRLAPLNWQYRPAGLLAGRVDVKVQLERGAGRASAVVGVSPGGNIHLADVDVAIPAGELVQMLRLPLVQVSGEVDARLDSVQLQASRIAELNGTLTWNKAQVLKPQPYQLGGLEAVFNTDNDVVKGTLRDKGGPLQVDGLVTLKPDGTYQVNANVGTRDNSQPTLNRLINSLGRQRPGGKVAVSHSGKMPPLPVSF